MQIKEYKGKKTESCLRKNLSSAVASKFSLSSSLSNQATLAFLKSHTVQAKLKIGQSNDKYELEADRVADHIMRMPDIKAGNAPNIERQSSLYKIQRTCASCVNEYQDATEENRMVDSENLCPECRIQKKPLDKQLTPLVQRREFEEKNLLQKKPYWDSASRITSAIDTQIQSMRGAGTPLSKSERSFFEPRFGANLSDVRIHTGSRADGLAKSINARAFTLGRDIFFGSGEYSPMAVNGKKLLAHELTHVIQQGGSRNRPTMIGKGISYNQNRKIQRKVRFFVCNSADETSVGNTISMSVPSSRLRSLTDTASETAANWAYNAVSLLRRSPRSATIRSAFRDAYGANPDWVPPWFATLGVRLVDFGDLIAERLQRVANILSGGWIQYYCWGSPTRCPECTSSPPTYDACSSYLGRYQICLGPGFWRLWASGNTDHMALILLHEALHIYFSRTVSHAGRSGNAFCYERFIAEANSRPIQPGDAAACPTAP